MTSSTFIWTLTVAIITMAANLLLRLAFLGTNGKPSTTIMETMVKSLHLFLNLYFTSGCLLYFCAALVWFKVLSLQETNLSLVYPVLVALTFVSVTVGAATLFGELMSWVKIVGLVVILVGIAIVCLAPET